MPTPAKDLTGQKFGSLTVLRRTPNPNPNSKSRVAFWECRCDCGTVVIRQSQYLRNPKRTYPRHCGCQPSPNKKHGLIHHPIYSIWGGIKGRCHNPNDKDYYRYGERGITVCERWRDSFEAFFADMAPTYRPGLTLDRKNNSAGYSPDNCHWTTPRQQARNTRTNVWVETPKGPMVLIDAARYYNLKPSTVYRRARLWPREKWFIPLTRSPRTTSPTSGLATNS